MKILKKISLKIGKDNKTIYFGMPDNNEEFDEMYGFRYKVYLEHNYIVENKEEKDIDKYDSKSKYFIAKIDNKIIGTVRLIQNEYLPAEKDCFEFIEPLKISKIPRNQRAELGRLIVKRYNEKLFLPRHLVLLGLLSCVMNYALENNIKGGYSFIKNSLKIKLKKLKFPFYIINNFKQVYDGGILDNYFKDKKDPVWPVYYVTDEIVPYFNKIFSNRLFFRQIGSDKFLFKNNLIYKIIQKI